MKHLNAYRISVFLAVVGLTLMYGSSKYIRISHADIGEIEKSWSGRNVRISGEVTRYTRSGGNIFLTVNDSTGSILVVEFDSDYRGGEGDHVNVTGHVSVYEGELEIIAKKIERTGQGFE